MNRLKKTFRLLGLVVLILLASTGIGILGAVPVFSHNRERYLDNEIKIELFEKKEDESDTQLNDIFQ